MRSFITQKNKYGFGFTRRLPPFGEILRVLGKYNLLPAIFFLKSRSDCDHAVEMCEKSPSIDPEKKEKIHKRIRELAEQSPYILDHRQLDFLQRLTVGAHHSGQLPIWKQTLETLMTEGLMNAVFATSTVAAGVNFPARTIVFLNSDRFNGHEFLPLNSTEFHQMTGRAGRRGMDQIGFAVLIPGRFMDPKLVARLVGAPPSDVLSQIRINFSMVLNLLMSHTLIQVKDLLKNSFAAFLIAQKKKGKKGGVEPEEAHKYLWADFLRHHTFLKNNGFVDEDDGLTSDGTWASQLRVDQPLMIAEGFRKSAFPENDPSLMAAIFAAFVNEREFDDRFDAKGLEMQVKKALNKMKRKLSPFIKKMKADRFEVRELYLRPAVAVYAWASGLPWDRVWRLSEMEEGNFVMLVLRTSDNLRHVQSLWEVFPRAASAAGEALDLILKDPVLPDYEDETKRDAAPAENPGHARTDSLNVTHVVRGSNIEN